MRRQGPCFALIALVILILLIAGACSPFRLAKIDHQDIPASIREQVDASVPFDYSGLVFRAFYEQEDYVVVAYTYTLLNVGAHQEGFGVEAFSVDPTTGAAEHLGRAMCGVFHLQYGWEHGGSIGSEDTRVEYAGGWALSNEAHRAVVSTSRGRTVEAQIVDGVWLARIEVDPSGLEKLLSATVMDEGGRVLFTDRRY